MPKCANVVVLVILTNVLTLTIYSTIKYEHIPYLSNFPISEDSQTQNTQPLPQPNQLSNSNQVIQTGRVIQSFKERDETSTSSTNGITSSKSDAMSELFESRQKVMKNACVDIKKNRREIFVNDPSHLFVLQDRGIAWCPVFKAGSSTWLSTILELSSKSTAEKEFIKKRHPGNFLQQGRSVAPSLPRGQYLRYRSRLNQQNKTETSFIVVRHPFERLVSAYRDKLERKHATDYLKDFYYKTYGRKIVQKYRQAALKKFGDDFFSATNNYGAPIPVANGGRPSSDLPVFWEFVQFVIESRKLTMDEHWKPVTNYCSLCTLRYDYVIKFEDYINEGKAFLRHSNLTKFVKEDVLEQQINPNRPGEMSSSELTAKYFGLLSEEDIRKLYHVYENDFQLFDYTFKLGKINLP